MISLNTTDDGLLMRDSGAWTKEKLDYLNRYIDIFEIAMRGKFHTRFYIDLLAGPGKNRIRNSHEVILGSPLIALNTQYKFSHYIFNEYDEDNFHALEKRCEFYSQDNIKKYNQDCNIIVDEIVSEINNADENSLNLGFIDPEGFEVHWTTIEKLATIQRIDLLIYYPQMGLNQNLVNYYECEDECIIDLFFGTTQWRKIYSELRSKNKLKNIHRELIDLYKGQLCDLGYVHVLSNDEIDDEPLIRNSKRKAPLYRLLFASKHSLGHDFWRKITRRDVYGQGKLF